MTETIRQAKSVIDELTEAKTIQALLVLIITITLAVMVVNGTAIPEWLQFAWFTLLGVYMELPQRKLTPTP